MRAYQIGKSIILPHVRFVNHGGQTGIMFHSEVLRTNGRYQTLGCDKTDASGFCLGHKISREEFLKRYCGGIETEQDEGKKDKDEVLMNGS
jgi:hypothetical protein